MPYSDQLLTRYLSLVTQPVSAQGYAGEDARFSIEFEALEGELAKAQSMHGAGPVDWPKVRQGSEAILQSMSKDLRVACWLSWALYQTESFAGLSAGCAMISHLCREQWSDFFPQKARTRCAAMVWFVARLEQALAGDVAIKDQLALFERLEASLQGIDEAFTRQLGDEAPLLLPLRRRLTAMILKAREAEPRPASVIAQVKQAAVNLFAPAATIDNEKDARRAYIAQEDNGRLLCGWWLRNRASDVRALRLNRVMTWLQMERLPGHDAQNKTQLSALPAEKLQGYQERFEQGGYADLVVDLEASLSRAPFWFDGQHLVWKCLKALKAEAAMREVEIQLALFLMRLPGLAQLRFEDGQPFADAATQRWIASRVTPVLQAEREPPAAESLDSRLPWDAVLDDAIPMLQSDGIKSVAQLFKPHIQSASGERAKFYWRLSLARICHQARKYELAKSQLEVLDEQLKSDGLADWEPDLNLEVLRLLYSCCELLPQNKVVREYKEALYRRLCHLDMETVLE